MTKKVFLLLRKKEPKQDRNSNSQLFLTCLLAPLVLAGRPRFYLVVLASGLIVGRTISGVVSTRGKVAIGFSG